jgi:UDP-N-acetylmuramate--alanine ligase
MIASPADSSVKVQAKRAHLLGVGGMGMAPLALWLAGSGWEVSGEDDQLAPEVEAWLQSAGVTVRAGLPEQLDLVVRSSAIGSDHPRRREAEARGIPMARRGEMLAEAVRGKRLIAVAGSHGKTTTTAMVIAALQAAGIEAGYLLGGLFADPSMPPARWSEAPWVVAEVDESDGSIAGFHPEITVCVNLDWDHCDHYRTPAAIEEAFAALRQRTSGIFLFNASCPTSVRTFAGTGAVSFGAGGDYCLEGVSVEQAGLQLRLSGRFGLTAARVRAQGRFNAENATAALAVAATLGAPSVESLLSAFPGVRRRQSELFNDGRVAVVEDYAHHPAEIRALLAAQRELAGDGRLIVAFQPHRFSRTLQFKEAFAAELAVADALFLLEVYAASEAPIEGGRIADLAAALQRMPAPPLTHCFHQSDDEAASALLGHLQAKDRLLFIGAGDIEKFARRAVALLKARSSAAAAEPADAFLALVRTRLSADAVLREREGLAQKTTLRVGGPARVYAEPASLEDMSALLKSARQVGFPVLLLGRGSNLIVPDDGVSGLVIRLHHPHWQRFEPLADGRIRVGSGLRLKELCGHAVRLGLQGFEFLEGIPGSVGGALRMNAGAMGGWMFDVVEEVLLMDEYGESHVALKEQMDVGYRHCAQLERSIALGAVLRPAASAEGEEIRERIAAYQTKRHASQPREASAGCIFKNPPGDSAGRIIDQLGLKGMRVGDAEVSTVHGNFIINRGHASAADVLALIRQVREQVRRERQIDLEPEVLLYGREWKDVL